MGFGAAPTSLGKLTEAERLFGNIKLKEGTNITLTRVDADNALQIAAAAGAVEGFCDHYNLTLVPPENLDRPIWRSDEIILSERGTNNKLILESDELYTWGVWHDCYMYFNTYRGSRAPTNMRAFFGMNRGDPDIYNNWNNHHIGVYLDGYRWYASNGGGSGFTRTLFGVYSPDTPMSLKIHRSATDIKWYRNGILLATHNTNLPAWSSGYKEHYSCMKLNDTRGDLCCQHIQFFSGLFP